MSGGWIGAVTIIDSNGFVETVKAVVAQHQCALFILAASRQESHLVFSLAPIGVIDCLLCFLQQCCARQAFGESSPCKYLYSTGLTFQLFQKLATSVRDVWCRLVGNDTVKCLWQ